MGQPFKSYLDQNKQYIIKVDVIIKGVLVNFIVIIKYKSIQYRKPIEKFDYNFKFYYIKTIIWCRLK